MSGPKRHGFGNLHDLKYTYRQSFFVNFIVGGIMAWPLAIIIGRRATHYQGGVAVVPYKRWIHNHPNCHPNVTTKKFFNRYSRGTMALSGFLFAYYFTNDSQLNNTWYTRPDIKPYMAMVRLEDQTDYDPVAYKQLLEANYKHYKEEPKKGFLYRFIWSNEADFTPKTNLYHGRHSSMNFNAKTGEMPMLNHDYADHKF